jgi:twinkle protein
MIIKAGQFRDEVQGYRRTGLEIKGLEVGLSELDTVLKFKIALGRFMVVTGIPGMGKSEVLDAMIMNMAIAHEWRTLYFSPENNPEDEHVTALVEKFVGKRITACTASEVDAAIDWLVAHVTWTRPADKSLVHILEIAKQQKEKAGLEWLIIDPWNYVTQSRGQNTVSEHLSNSLNLITTFTREENVLVTVVAHPTNLPRDKEGNSMAPDLYTINDGAQWRNKMDQGIVIHRPNMLEDKVEFRYLKRKKKWMGKLGTVVLDYDADSGRVKCQDDKEFLLPNQAEAPFPMF